MGKLVRDHGLDRGGGRFLADSGVFEPALEARTYVRVFPCHDCNSLNRCLASARSSVGVFCVFLIIACTGDQQATMKSEEYPRLALARQRRTDLPQAAAQGTTQRQTHRPAVLHFGDVASDGPLIAAG